MHVEKDCPFCNIVVNRQNDIVLDLGGFVAFKARNPQGKNHYIVIPQEHYDGLINMPPALNGAFLSAIRMLIGLKGLATCRVLINVGEANGQKVRHLHAHVFTTA